MGNAWTPDASADRFEDETFEEIIGGKVFVRSSPPHFNHGVASDNVRDILKAGLNGRAFRVFGGNQALWLSKKDCVIPDAMAISENARFAAEGVHGVPALVVEVLSPDTEARDRTVKRDLYARRGVKEYWLVDPPVRSVEVFRLQGHELAPAGEYRLATDAGLGEGASASPVRFRCAALGGIEIGLDQVFQGMIPF